MRGAASLLLALVSVVALAAPAAAAESHVAVRDNSFEPATVRIEPGDTVTWEWQGSTAHTVTATDRSFHSGQRTTGTFSHTFADPGTYAYLCLIHGDGGMTGVVQVGDPPPTEPLPSPVVFVPSDGIELDEAVARAGSGTTIVLEPGIHTLRSPILLATTGVEVRGGRRAADGAVEDVNPADVVVASAGATATAVRIVARGDGHPDLQPLTRIRDVTIRGFRVAGVEVVGAEGFSLYGLRLVPPAAGWDFGVLLQSSRRGRLEDLHVSGARLAAVSIRDCDSCDTTVERLHAEHSHTGFEVGNARYGIEIRNSELRDNVNGVIVGTRPGSPPSTGVVVRNNTVEDHDPRAPRPPITQLAELQPGAGAGIWLAGTQQTLVTGNHIAGQRYGIVVTAGGSGSRDDRIVGNHVHRSQQADLAWDGVGAGTCFGGNRTPSGSDATSSPAAIQTLYPCDRPTVGVPNPLVTADLAVTAVRLTLCGFDSHLCV